MLNKIQIFLQSLLPKKLITQLIGWGAEWHGGIVTHWIITLFVRFYKINMKEAKISKITDYKSFNEFFTRFLCENARPIDTDPSILVMPADGTIYQLGLINNSNIFQAKSHNYSLEALLAGNEKMINCFNNGNSNKGSFVAIYLSPQNYHRIHMPCDGTLREVVYVPGELFPVNSFNVNNISNLFARNERLICLFDTNFGPIVQILIGAMIVGSIETVWLGSITPPRQGIIKRWCYQQPQKDLNSSIVLLKGQEMGHFKLGSTVINLFPSDNIKLNDHLHPGCITQVGLCLAYGTITIQNDKK